MTEEQKKNCEMVKEKIRKFFHTIKTEPADAFEDDTETMNKLLEKVKENAMLDKLSLFDRDKEK